MEKAWDEWPEAGPPAAKLSDALVLGMCTSPPTPSRIKPEIPGPHPRCPPHPQASFVNPGLECGQEAPPAPGIDVALWPTSGSRLSVCKGVWLEFREHSSPQSLWDATDSGSLLGKSKVCPLHSCSNSLIPPVVNCCFSRKCERSDINPRWLQIT